MQETEQPQASSVPSIWVNPGMAIILTFLAFSFLMGLGGVLATQVTSLMGVDVAALMNDETKVSYTLAERQALRWSNVVAHLVAFAGAALLMTLLSARGRVWSVLQLRTIPGVKVVGLAVLCTLVGLPGVQLVNWLNNLIPLPEGLSLLEDSQNALLAAVLQMESPVELLTGLFMAAVVPAVGEELLFRGVLQPRFQALLGHPHRGIWLTAVVFSAIHMQFAGFFPRMLLGAFLGYLLWWSSSLWLPIIVHFFFNGIQVVATYFQPDAFKTAEEISMGWAEILLGVGSILLLVGLLPKLVAAAKKDVHIRAD